MRSIARFSHAVTAALCAVLVLAAVPLLAGSEPLELVDLMKLRTLYGPVISEDGAWVAYELRPDRGDGELVVRSAKGRRSYSVERGSDAKISADSRWVAALVRPTLEEREKAEKAKKKKEEGPKTGLAMLATADGAVETVERVKSFAFSADGRWLAYHRSPAEDEREAEPAEEEAETEEEAKPEAPPEVEGVPEPALPPEPEPGEEPPPTPAPEVEPPPAEPSPEPMPGPELVREPPAAAEPEPVGETAEGAKEKEKDERVGSTLVLRDLAGGAEVEVPHVEAYAFDATSSYLAYATAAPGGEGNGVYLRRLGATGSAVAAVGAAEAGSEIPLRRDPRGRYTELAWTGEEAEASRLGFVAAVDDEGGDPGDGTLHVWDGELVTALASGAAPEGWFVPSKNELAWSDDGRRLFFGLKPLDEKLPDEDEDEDDESEGGGEGAEQAEAGAEEEEEPFDPYDVEALLEDRGVDVWHWDDPQIVPYQKKQWKDEKDRTYRAAYHVGSPGADGGRVVPLADREMRLVEPSDNPAATLGRADVPYLKEITWDGWYFDLYRVRLADGSRQLVAERLRETPVALSPAGRYAVYWRSPHWYLFDGESGETRNLTEGLETPYADEDHDYPEAAPGYGTAEWVAPAAAPEGGPLAAAGAGEPAEATAVLIYDKFDLWRFPVDAGAPECVTGGEGRRRRIVLRRIDLDPPGRERDSVPPDARLLLTAYDDREKHRGFAEARLGGEPGFRFLDEARGHYVDFVARAREADRLLYSRESYTEFPDLWVADLDLRGRRRLSEANPEIARYGWGEAELVEWHSADGVPLQGVLIKPAGYERGRRYPVLVYFYRLFSQRLHRFNELAVNHRPSFPHYASHGYAVFLPDIRFEVGRPGHSATQALVSGVQKLVEKGVADPERIGLHGHSWSGYQTAFVVTQTDLFRAAVAGAPVSNMTSAYGGIRYGSGLARMFQYEQSQSRMGASLWQARDRYIESSPLFYADRVRTPLLIEFGDEDEAVPWTQGIELYLALRRLGKPAWMLQYRGEGHHLEQYPNKLDYSIKMREFFDHYLKGAPAAEWMTEGVPYEGE